jgi:hypothetical protein
VPKKNRPRLKMVLMIVTIGKNCYIRGLQKRGYPHEDSGDVITTVYMMNIPQLLLRCIITIYLRSTAKTEAILS